MNSFSTSLEFQTSGRGIYPIEERLRQVTNRLPPGATGTVTLWIRHTSASLIVSENADPDVLTDLETVLAQLLPDGDPRYTHRLEGPDDMAAHLRSVLTQTSLVIPVVRGKLDLGQWQTIYLWEHRYAPHRRTVSVVWLGTVPVGSESTR